MALGRKTGGRVAGTPNKRTVELASRLDALGCDPIEGMARLAMDEANPPELRGRMYAELAGYVYPKRKAIEHSAEDGSAKVTLGLMLNADPRHLSSADLTNRILQDIAAGNVPADDVPDLMKALREELGAR